MSTEINISVEQWIDDFRTAYENDPLAQAEYLKIDLLESVLSLADEANLTRTEIAERYGCSTQYLSKILRGPQNMSIETIVKLVYAVNGRLEFKVSPALIAESHECSVYDFEVAQRMIGREPSYPTGATYPDFKAGAANGDIVHDAGSILKNYDYGLVG